MTIDTGLKVETRYGVRLLFDGREDKFHDLLDISLPRARDIIDRHQGAQRDHPGWRVTKVILLTQRVDVHPWHEEEEEGAHGR